MCYAVVPGAVDMNVGAWVRIRHKLEGLSQEKMGEAVERMFQRLKNMNGVLTELVPFGCMILRKSST